MKIYMLTLARTLVSTSFFTGLLTACSTTTPSAHQEHNHDAENRQFNPKILNCVGPNGHHVYETELTCPSGGRKFTALELGTHSTMGVYLDWQPISYMRFPVAIPVCPNGFIMDLPNPEGDALAKRKAYVESAEYQKLYKQKHASFYLFGKQSEALRENLDNLWYIYLQATWEADGCQNREKYKEYAALVIEKANEQRTKLTEKDEEYWPINIVIADMYRRTGQFELAQEQLNTIGTPTFEKQKSNDFFMLAKKVMQTAINEKSVEAFPIKEPIKKTNNQTGRSE